MGSCSSGILRPLRVGCSNARIVKNGVGLKLSRGISPIFLFYLLSDAEKPLPVSFC